MEIKTRGTEYGICRCCQAKGNHRNISKEYVFQGGREVYIEIFMDCFNLFLAMDESASQLICTKCITHLRDANQFRSMVVEAERQLNDATSKLDTVFINVPTEKEPEQTKVKNEPELEIKTEFSEDEVACDSEYLSPDDLLDDEASLIPGEKELLARANVQKPLPTTESLYCMCPHFVMKSDSSDEASLIPGEKELITRANIQNPLPTRESLYYMCPQFVRHLDLLSNMNITSEMIKSRLNQTPAPQKVFISEKQAHLTNVSTLIQNSNMTPFKSKTRSGFPCYYCRKLLEDLHKLRLHSEVHKPSEIVKTLIRERKQKGIESLVVYVDVTDLKCTICHKNMPNIAELKSHLVKEHKKKLYPQVTDRVIPFKMHLEQFQCQICLCNFETFGSIERHMNGHYRNYVCKDCGTGFITKYRLKVHTKSMHVDGTHPCEFCGKIFSSQQKYKNHVNTVHKQVKRFKCPKCSVRFGEYFKRQRHMEEIHGFAPLKYKCNVCDKSFDRRYTLSRHLKRDHLEERDYQCEVCAYKCFTKNELTVHMVKHGGERIFECSVCKKSYARKKTLREHMRIHNNDRRFACAVCGQAFVQKCSLKGHLKTHHCNWVLDGDSNKCTER